MWRVNCNSYITVSLLVLFSAKENTRHAHRASYPRFPPTYQNVSCVKSVSVAEMILSGMSGSIFIQFLVTIVVLIVDCSQLADGNVASVLARGFSTDSQLSLAEQDIRQIPFKSFNERPSHGVKYGMSTGDFTTFVRSLSSNFAIPKDTENSILDGLYAEVNREVVREINFSKGSGYVTYGQVSTLRHNDGRIDLAHTIHHLSFQLQPAHKKKKQCRRHKNKKPRNLSEQELTAMMNYAKYKAITNFRSGHAGDIATGDSCPSEGCS